jgi:ubiquinone/menaquinone biosynthesis C-methylase UbiE
MREDGQATLPRHDPAPDDPELGLPGLVELAAGYQRAQVLFAASELGVFRLLSGGPRPATEIARALEADVRGVEALLDACVALRILRRSDGGYENSRTARLFLAPAGAMSFAPAIEFWARLSYGPWGRLAHAVRDNQPQTATGPKARDLFDQLGDRQSDLELFFDGLATLAYWPARKLAQLVDFGQHRRVLDVGGGSGAFAEVIARQHPHLQVTLFDHDAVCALARARLRRAGAPNRIATASGDFHRDPLPREHDCALVSNVLHDWSPGECRSLLRSVHDALDPGGQVVVYDFAPARRGDSTPASLFSLALLLDTKRGQVYTRDEIEDWLRQASFGQLGHHAITADTSAITARKAPR